MKARISVLLLASAGSLAFAGRSLAAPDAPEHRNSSAPSPALQLAVDEFKIQTRDLGLRSDGTSTVAKTGPKPQWHGRFYENFRNDAMDAVPHEITQNGGGKGLLRRNQFGFNIGGPVWIPHLIKSSNDTHFSLSFEGVRERISRTHLRTIPTPEERAGDFSHTVDQSGNQLPIFDPDTTRANPNYDPSKPVSTANLQYLRDSFLGNRIPASRLDPVATQLADYYPTPNSTVGPFLQNNYFINSPEQNSANGIIAKLDHAFGDQQRLAGEIDYSNGTLVASKYFDNAANPGNADRNFQTRRGEVDHVFTISSSLVNTLTLEAVSSTVNTGDAQGMGQSSGAAAFPKLDFESYLGQGRQYPFSHNADNSYLITEGISKRLGKHSLRGSARFRMAQLNSLFPQFPAGYFHFSAGYTSLPGIVNTGRDFASFLLGAPDYAESTTTTQPSYFRRNSASFSFNDDWQLQKGLTLSLGLTVQGQAPRTEKYDHQSTVDLAVVNPDTGAQGALVAAGRDGNDSAFRPTIWALDPSLGVSWSPDFLPKTLVRAGYSRSHRAVPIYAGQWGTQGFNSRQTLVSPNAQLAPATSLENPFPPLPYPLPDLRPSAADGTVADLMDRSSREPLYQSASLTVERELPFSLVVSVGASYSGGRDLLVGNSAANPNAVPLDDLKYRDQLNNLAFNESLRPYPQYQGFDLFGVWPSGKYQRDAGFVRLEKRASLGLTLSAYYEFSKQLDDYSGPYGMQDFYDASKEWALTSYNSPQFLQLSYSYELPFGTNKGMLSFEDWRRHLVDGWAISGTAFVTSGTPVALRPEFNDTGGVVQALHVNSVPGVDPTAANQGPSLWFNPAAFDQPADFTIGDYSRTSPSLRNPGTQNYDLTVTKRFSVSAAQTLEFTAAGFNFLNHADWNYPDSTIGPASAPNLNAGKIIGSHGGRVIQLGLRYSF